MRVDFYQLTRDPAEAVVPLLARNTLAADQRLLVVSGDDAQLLRVSQALWSSSPESFLAHGPAGGENDARQPILLTDRLDATNGARFLALADGLWREGADQFERVFLLFDSNALQGARECWRMLGTRPETERKFWKQEGGRWVEGP
ncbi:DNA polymerase III subunit chi [Novosphingobium tardum]|uniref:DNA polymerase III subunit chi n=1 Tax=Novosphingobium tardum TaxID=1538021 RepID=A0ABV8RNP4_9SPHN